MRTISLTNLKGGVGKTTTAINMATILAKLYNQRVLLVDNDVKPLPRDILTCMITISHRLPICIGIVRAVQKT